MPIALPDVLTSGGNPYVVQDTDIRGGYRAVATVAMRDAIPVQTRKPGMCVFVVADRKTYRYEQNEWLELPDGEALAEALKNKLNYEGSLEVCRATYRGAGTDRVTIHTGIEAVGDLSPILTLLMAGGEQNSNKFYRIDVGWTVTGGVINVSNAFARCTGTVNTPQIGVGVFDNKFVVQLTMLALAPSIRLLVRHNDAGDQSPPLEQLVSGWSITFGDGLIVDVPITTERSVMRNELGTAAALNATNGPYGSTSNQLWRTNDLVKQVDATDRTFGRIATVQNVMLLNAPNTSVTQTPIAILSDVRSSSSGTSIIHRKTTLEPGILDDMEWGAEIHSIMQHRISGNAGDDNIRGWSYTSYDNLNLLAIASEGVLVGNAIPSFMGHGTINAARGVYDRGVRIPAPEQGTFTPFVTGEATAGTATYIRQRGMYIKTGRRVDFMLRVEYTDHTGTGNLHIDGLPFAAMSDGNFITVVHMYCNDLPFPEGHMPLARIISSETRVSMRNYNAVLGTYHQRAVVNSPDPITLRFNGTYYTD